MSDSRVNYNNHTFDIDGLAYKVEAHRVVTQPLSAPRLLMVVYLPSDEAIEIMRVAVRAIQRFTKEPYELWLIDNASPDQRGQALLTVPGVNVAFNYTTPRPPEFRTWRSWWRRFQQQFHWGSYAQGIGMEILLRLIDVDSHYIASLDMDVMPVRENWLSYLQSRMNERIRAAGFLLETARLPEGLLHAHGYLVDYQLFRQLACDFLPHWPQYDNGDLMTARFREAGYEVFACPNTLHHEELVEKISEEQAYLRTIRADRAFDDQWNVIFMHLGRGVRKSIDSRAQGTSAQTWLECATKLGLRPGAHVAAH